MVTWARVLAWRSRRLALDSPVDEDVAGVVGRLVALPAFPDAGAELAVRLRQAHSEPGAVARAVDDGRVLKVFLFRGATHLATHEHAATHLALRAAGRMWERSSWRAYYGLEPDDWPSLRHAAREALDDGPLTVPQFVAALTLDARFRHLRPLVSDNWTLLKALMWQGDLCFGAPRDGEPTFRRLDSDPRWPGLPDLDDAGPRAILAYVHAYGPTTPERLHYWLGEGLGAGRSRLRAWLASMGGRLVEVDVDGQPTLVARDDLDSLLTADEPTEPPIRLLPAFDQWVLGPGTADERIVPPAHRVAVSRGANLVTRAGVVAGTWTATRGALAVRWLDEPAPPSALDEQAARLGALLGQPIAVAVDR